MDRGVWGFIAGAVIAAAVGGYLGHAQSAVFEAKAQQAETFVRNQQVEVDMWHDAADFWSAAAAKQDTVVKWRTVEIARVDSVHPAPADCAPNIAARDSALHEQSGEIAKLQASDSSWAKAFAALQLSKDTIAAALAARPHSFKRFLPPNVGLGFVLDPSNPLHPQIRLSVNLVGVRL